MSDYQDGMGNVFKFTGEYDYVTLGNSRTASRNRLKIRRPIYKCDETGKTIVLMPATSEEMLEDMREARQKRQKNRRGK